MDVKKALLKASKELLVQSDQPENITSRQIASHAGTHAAMINYYYQSKDGLLTEAVGELISEAAEQFYEPQDSSVPAKERLRRILWQLCRLVTRFSRYSKIFVPYVLLEGKIEAPYYILPVLREHFAGKKTELECRVIAYQLISFLQLAFYRSGDFYQYAGVNMEDTVEQQKLMDMEIDLLL